MVHSKKYLFQNQDFASIDTTSYPQTPRLFFGSIPFQLNLYNFFGHIYADCNFHP